MAWDGLNDEEEPDAVTPSFDARRKETTLTLDLMPSISETNANLVTDHSRSLNDNRLPLSSGMYCTYISNQTFLLKTDFAFIELADLHVDVTFLLKDATINRSLTIFAPCIKNYGLRKGNIALLLCFDSDTE